MSLNPCRRALRVFSWVLPPCRSAARRSLPMSRDRPSNPALRSLRSEDLKSSERSKNKSFRDRSSKTKSVSELLAEDPESVIIKEDLATPASDIRAALSIDALMKAGVHLGHATESWNQNMLPYIYGERNRIHIINLEHTLTELRRACGVLKGISSIGGRVLFVAKRPQLRQILYNSACKSSSYYAFDWHPSLFSPDPVSFKVDTYLKSNKRFINLVNHGSPVEKKEVVDYIVNEEGKPVPIKRIMETPTISASTIQEDQTVKIGDVCERSHPDIVVLLDYHNFYDLISSANKNQIPIISICDTDCDPNVVQYAIPGNDDSVSSVALIANVLVFAIREGLAKFQLFSEKSDFRKGKDKLP